MVKKTGYISTPRWVSEFRAFLSRGNAVDLAVGVIIGAAFTGIVNSVVKDIFTPIIGLVVGGIDFSNIFITLKGQHMATLAEAQRVGAVTLNVGLFLNAVFQFVIIGFVIFWMVKALTKMRIRQDSAEPKLTKQEILLSEIRDILSGRLAGKDQHDEKRQP